MSQPFANVCRSANEALGTTLALVTPTDHAIFHDKVARRGVSLDPAKWVAHMIAVENGSPRDYERFPFVVVDLFAGAGGSSNGVLRALRALRVPVLLIMINHWETAIATQLLNFPYAMHFNASVETPDPRAVVPWLHVDQLVASPECVTYSPARGKKKEIREQSRSSAAYLLTWLERVTVIRFAFENVKEWRTNWGRMNATGTATLKGYEGEYFRAFMRKLKKLGYTRPIDDVLNAASYGSATNRHRLFVFGIKGKPVNTPEPTHTAFPEKYPHLKPLRTARQIIDFTDLGESSFARFDQRDQPDGPHAINSLKRTRAGYLRQIAERPGAAAYARAFELYIPIAREYHDATPPTDKKLETAKLARANVWRARYGLPEQDLTLEKRPREREIILERAAAEWREHYNLVGSGVLSAKERRVIKEVNVARSREATRKFFAEPIMAFTSAELARTDIIADGTLISQHSFGGDGTHSLDEQVPSITTISRHRIDQPQFAEASIIRANAGENTTFDDIAVSVNRPLGSPTGTESKALALPLLPEPLVMGQHGGSIARPVDAGPLMTAAAGGAISVQTPTIAEQQLTCVGHGEGDARYVSMHRPVPAVTAKRNVAIDTPLAEQALVIMAHGAHTDDEVRSVDIDGPLGAIHAGGNKYGLGSPVIADAGLLTMYGGFERGVEASLADLDSPAPSISAQGHHHGIFQPPAESIADASLMSKHYTYNENPPLDAPLPTTDTRGAGYVNIPQIAEGSLVSRHSGHGTDCRAHSFDRPVPAATGEGAGYISQPAIASVDADGFIYEPHGERETQRERVHPLDEPTLTVTPRGVGTLVTPATAIRNIEFKPKILIDNVLHVIDSMFRMLRNRELAKAMDLIDESRGFEFSFAGSAAEVTKQIGNAVASNVMEALTLELCRDIQGLPHEVPMMDVLIGPIAQPAVGDRYGIYNERVVRAITSSSSLPTPAWFAPRVHATHVAIHTPDRAVMYLELSRNDALRETNHPYEIAVVQESNEPTTLSLFGETAIAA